MEQGLGIKVPLYYLKQFFIKTDFEQYLFNLPMCRLSFGFLPETDVTFPLNHPFPFEVAFEGLFLSSVALFQPNIKIKPYSVQSSSHSFVLTSTGIYQPSLLERNTCI